MTTTPHGQVPEALIDLIDAYAETRHRCGGVYNAKTEAARNAVIEALSGMQALSAAPMVTSEQRRLIGVIAEKIEDGTLFQSGIYQKKDLARFVRNMLDVTPTAPAASPTSPAEQQATKETSGGLHVWRDISTAPKDGSIFVATGHNYGLYSEVRHTCVAQWFQGCWMEASDWNETSELKYLTHWMPLPPLPGNAARKAAPATVSRTQHSQFLSDVLTAAGLITHGKQCKALGDRLADMVMRLRTAPQQEAQEPVAWQGVHDQTDLYYTKPLQADVRPLYAAPRPAPAPVSDEVVRDAAFEAVRKKLCTLPRYSFVLDDDGLVRRAPDRTGNWIEFDEAHALFDPVSVEAALAAQGGKCPMRIEP